MINQDMNFFSPYQGKKKEEKNENIYLYSLMILLVLTIVGTFAFNSISIFNAKAKIKNYEEELAKEEIVEKVKIYEGLDAKHTALTNYEGQIGEVIEASETRAVVSTELINSISSTLPTEVTISAISIEKTKILIKGVSTSRVAIGELEHNLGKLNFISSVHVGSIAGGETFNFDISCNLKDVE